MQRCLVKSTMLLKQSQSLLMRIPVRTIREIGPADSTPFNSPMEGQSYKIPSQLVTTPEIESHRKNVEEVIGDEKKPTDALTVDTDPHKEVMEIGGVPEEHREGRRAVIYMPARTAMQAGWDNTGVWKIELDNRERWENPAIGWSSSADPLSNISMQLSFASRDDAINFCEKNRWTYEISEPKIREIKPKAYGSNFSWNKRTRVSTK